MYTKSSFLGIIIVLTMVFSGCKKDKKPEASPPVEHAKYSSVKDFYSKNEVKIQTYKIDATTGGSFTSPKGTQVSIPANCFVTSGNTAATGEVTVQFKDIYSKSDMLLSDVPTNFFNGTPLKSGGEFFINALLNNQPLEIAPGKSIEIEQPAEDLKPDTAMRAMVLVNDSIPGGGGANNGGGGWFVSQNNDLLFTTTSYVFTLYQFSGTNGAGTWCNSDNSYYFQAYTQTTLTVNNVGIDSMDVFLVFKNVNSMVHVYRGWNSINYPYTGAPVGLECTVVSVAVKDEKLYAAFTPITITSNLTVNPVLNEITTEDFKAQLNALN